jgi:hypothetical protein
VVDIEHFYDANPARRTSKEYSFGSEWTDPGGVRWELNWVEDTGEVYLMREAGEPLVMDPLGDTLVPKLPADEVTVEVIGTIAGLERVEGAFSGWSDAMPLPGSVAWVHERMADAASGDLHGDGSDDPPPTSLEGA